MKAGRRLPILDVVTAGLPAAGMVFAMQLEWVRSGSATRNSYEMFRSAQRLGLDELTPFRVVWFLMPVLCLGSLLMIGLARHHASASFLGAAFLGAASLVSLGVGVAVLTSGLGVGLGAPLATGSGAVGLLAVVVLVVAGRRSVSDRGTAAPSDLSPSD